MRKSRFSDEQILGILREADRTSVAEAAKKNRVSELAVQPHADARYFFVARVIRNCWRSMLPSKYCAMKPSSSARNAASFAGSSFSEETSCR
jgi:hypothetical protein